MFTSGFKRSSHFGIKKYLMPIMEPSKVTPLTRKIIITTYGNNAVT